MDLSLFQFDYDLTFSVFFMNADKTLYGRYGSRSSVEEATKDISLLGLRNSMESALNLHKGYPANRSLLSGKTGPKVKYAVPELYPALKGKFTSFINYTGNVVASCIHCHQVRDEERRQFRNQSKAIPDPVLFPWPMPNVIGISMDPDGKSRILTVEKGSTAHDAGLRQGDEIETLNGQSIISTADIQWVLHQSKPLDSIQTTVLRNGERKHLEIALKESWRNDSDISWRVTTWDLRRMVTGGLLLESLPSTEKSKRGLPENQTALRVKHVGQYGDHAVAKRAGFQKEDIIIEFDGRHDIRNETDLIAHAMKTRMPGKIVPVKIYRKGKKLDLQLKMQ